MHFYAFTFIGKLCWREKNYLVPPLTMLHTFLLFNKAEAKTVEAIRSFTLNPFAEQRTWMKPQCSRFCCCAVFHDADTRSLNGTSKIVPSVQSTFMSTWICGVWGSRVHNPVGAESTRHIVRAGDVTPTMGCGPDSHADDDESFWAPLNCQQDAQEGCKKDFWGSWTLRALCAPPAISSGRRLRGIQNGSGSSQEVQSGVRKSSLKSLYYSSIIQ